MARASLSSFTNPRKREISILDLALSFVVILIDYSDVSYTVLSVNFFAEIFSKINVNVGFFNY
jgi:hypothetical protein